MNQHRRDAPLRSLGAPVHGSPRRRNILLPVVVLVTGAACASDPTPVVSSEPTVSEAPAEEPAVVDDPMSPPESIADIANRYEFKCPGPFFALGTPETRMVGEHSFLVEGSTIKREGAPWDGPLVIGVVGAPKDPTDGTRENMKRAMAAFSDAGAHIVVVNGDLAEDNEIPDVLAMLAEEISLPLFVHAGNIEWAGTFTQAVVKVQKTHNHVVNMNWHRHVDLGGIHLVSLPGYYNPKYTRPGACRYLEKDLEALKAELHRLSTTGDRVIMTSHAPPRGEGARALDLAFDAGNVGDPRFRQILVEENIRYGLFSHILEAGGRAISDLETNAVVKLPMKKPTEKLYINAGSSSAFPWSMLDGKARSGMAAVFTLDGALASASFIMLDEKPKKRTNKARGKPKKKSGR